jgi:hypothetical protein
MTGARVLPVCPGEVLGWDHELIHWGSFCSDSPAWPCISLSMEFIAREEPPSAQELPLIDVGTLPTFDERLHFISRGALTFARHEPTLVRLKDLMEQVARETGSEVEADGEGPR